MKEHSKVCMHYVAAQYPSIDSKLGLAKYHASTQRIKYSTHCLIMGEGSIPINLHRLLSDSSMEYMLPFLIEQEL